MAWLVQPAQNTPTARKREFSTLSKLTALALLLLAAPAAARRVLIDGDTIDVDGTRIRICQAAQSLIETGAEAEAAD